MKFPKQQVDLESLDLSGHFELMQNIFEINQLDQLSKLKIYKGSTHPHEVQKPEVIDFGKSNSKNKIILN